MDAALWIGVALSLSHGASPAVAALSALPAFHMARHAPNAGHTKVSIGMMGVYHVRWSRRVEPALSIL
jgi:hypothetical protein